MRPQTREQRFKLSADLVIAHTQPGFEGIAIREALTRFPGTREVGRRSIADRNGMALLSAPRPEALAKMRCAENLFSMAGYARPLSAGDEGLEQARRVARQTPFVEAALQNRVRVTPGSRSGQRLGFRVVVRTVGSHEYRRVDLQRAIELGISERGDRRWRLEENGEVEFWATLLEDELFLAVRLSDDRMRQRDYKVAHFPGSLRPSVAAAMAMLSQPGDDDVVLDPLCGGATILVERAHLGRYKMLLGGDSNPEGLAAARENVGPRYKPIELRQWDATALPIPDGEVTRIITNLPWGRKFGSHHDNRRLYPKLISDRQLGRVRLVGAVMGGIPPRPGAGRLDGADDFREPPDARSAGAPRDRAQFDARGDHPRRFRLDLRLPGYALSPAFGPSRSRGEPGRTFARTDWHNCQFLPF